MIHIARADAEVLIAAKALETKGTLMQTRVGTPVIAGTGYVAGTARATGALFGLRSEVFYHSQNGSPLVDPRNNDQYAIAERTYLIGYDQTGVGKVTLN